MAATPILLARDLVKTVPTAAGPLTILDGVNLEVAAGEAVAVLGASGSGKSTLLGLLAGLDTPTGGTIQIDGVELGSLDEDGRAALRAGRVGFVFQSFQLLPSLSAWENVMLPLELEGQADARERARELLEQAGLGARLDHYPSQLSGGEQQRVAIARAFANRPRLLFADEPTGNLDRHTGSHVMDLLFDLNHDAHTTLVLVTHDESLARRCDRRLLIEEGRLLSA